MFPRALAGLLALVWSLGLAAQPPADLQLTPLISSGLDRPLALRHANDGSPRLFIVEQTGRIRIYNTLTHTLHAQPLLDLSSQIVTGGEQGLLGLAFHPDYANNGWFFVNYTRADTPKNRSVIARYQVFAHNPAEADPASAQVLLEFEQDAANHNGGDLHFGPDGYLYIASGDGGGGGDPLNRAQDKHSLLGKLLRIDVDTTAGNPARLCGLSPAAYAIPADNPYATGGGCGEVWALGLRNPWRISFDRASGDLFIGDVGQNQQEEINWQPAAAAGGRNYGWSCREGTLAVNFNACHPEPLTEPVISYPHALGCSVTGGYRYRGAKIGGLQGLYVYGDFCSGRVWLAREEAGVWQVLRELDTGLNIASFGEDAAGELYVIDVVGESVYRLDSPAALFGDDFEGG